MGDTVPGSRSPASRGPRSRRRRSSSTAASPASLRKASDELAERMPNAERRILRGESHNVSMKMLAPVLEDFLLDRR